MRTDDRSCRDKLGRCGHLPDTIYVMLSLYIYVMLSLSKHAIIQVGQAYSGPDIDMCRASSGPDLQIFPALSPSHPRRRMSMSTRVPENQSRISLGFYSNVTERLFCEDWRSWIPVCTGMTKGEVLRRAEPLAVLPLEHRQMWTSAGHYTSHAEPVEA